MIYKATYSGVPVFEYTVKAVPMMRRRDDDFLNATQILKIANFDKPQRTRILEREVQAGRHEKVQGGYGKYQGTWVPFERGIELAKQFDVEELMRPLIEFDPASGSPPPAPKHTVASGARKTPRATSPKIRGSRKRKTKVEETEDSESEDSLLGTRSLETTPRRRGRGGSPLKSSGRVKKKTVTDYDSLMEQGDYRSVLLSSFINEPPSFVPRLLLETHQDFDVNMSIDNEGHTALHWAAALGRVKMLQLLIERGADIFFVNNQGQTPLMRAVLFSNNFDNRTFVEVLSALSLSVATVDLNQQTVFHHAAITAGSKGKIHAARYYIESLVDYCMQHKDCRAFDEQDNEGNTPALIAAKVGNRFMLRHLINLGADFNKRNIYGECAQDYWKELEHAEGSEGSASDTEELMSEDEKTVLEKKPVLVYEDVSRVPTPIAGAESDFIIRPQTPNFHRIPLQPPATFPRTRAAAAPSPHFQGLFDSLENYQRSVKNSESTALQELNQESDLLNRQLDALKGKLAIVKSQIDSIESKIASEPQLNEEHSNLRLQYKNYLWKSFKSALPQPPTLAGSLPSDQVHQQGLALKSQMQSAEDRILQKLDGFVVLTEKTSPYAELYKQVISKCLNLPVGEMDNALNELLDAVVGMNAE